MAFIHPASGDYNSDLVSQLVMFLLSLMTSQLVMFLLALFVLSFLAPHTFPGVGKWERAYSLGEKHLEFRMEIGQNWNPHRTT